MGAIAEATGNNKIVDLQPKGRGSNIYNQFSALSRDKPG